MSKINILFNNKDYLIDESAFSSASNALKSHLTNVMNGSGEVINFDGISYNVDSTKLSNARNNLTSHFGTIAGNGSKVSINGVQYNIDSTKLSETISELENVFGNLNSEGSDNVTILPSTTLPFSPYGGNDIGVYVFETTEGFDVVKGKQYTVIFDGVAYKCTCNSFEFTVEGMTSEFLYAGNGDIFETVWEYANGEKIELESYSAPFVLLKGNTFGIMTTSTDPYHTIEILG